MARAYSTRAIKQNRSYTIDEAAECVGVSFQTVRQWIKQGLPAMTEKRPFLILGWELKTFLTQKQNDRRTPLGEGEFYCLSCRAARKPALGLVEQGVTSDGRAVLRAFCEACESPVNRFVNTRPLSRKQETAKRRTR